MTNDPLENFSLPTRTWFRETFGEPTPPQVQGWLPIQRGDHTLIFAPTGSGKTLAAFLWGIDELYDERRRTKAQSPNHRITDGVQLLYVSPLKALNNDIERNLRVPLEGIRATAERLGIELPTLRVAVRTGDTPSSARAAMLKHPPQILITTPESLYLMLTSPRAREMFRATRTVIVDEIHTLVGNKRGAHLALSLERLCRLATDRVQRIGLSATIKPLEEAARFLGGQELTDDRRPTTEADLRPPSSIFRPVTIVDAGYKKPLDLKVVTVVDDFKQLPGETIWPSVVPRVLNDIMTHRTTLIFANNRRLAERTADRLNAQLAAVQSEEIPPDSTEALAPCGLPRDRGMFAIGAEGPFRAHHGSMSKEARRKMEQDLKDGKLPALVGTSSLELGIDIGAVDLVVQLQSPKSVAQGLQRVGRSGHLVGQTSVGRIYATFREDLTEAAAIVRGMLDGDVEETRAPENPLDVLAQQIVAMVACETWSVPALYDLVRCVYPFRDLSRDLFNAVLAMLSGKYERVRAKIVWDRVNDKLAALPGSRLLALMNAGTISDTGAFGVYLPDGKTKIGELEEEFVFETKVGDAFLLGSHTWRVRDIGDDRLIVQDAAGATPRMPFWNGDYPYRPYELGKRIGRFRREVAERVGAFNKTPLQIEQWLQREYALDENSARNLLTHVQHQLDAVGVMSSDTTIVVETFQDAIGEPRMVIHSPFGGRVNGAWALAVASMMRERFGVEPETQTNDDGMIFRFPRSIEPPVDIVTQLTPAGARERIRRELPNSAVFGARFRMNAARALLLPKMRGRKRTPFWLQRLKAKDLLASVRAYDDFPIVAETYRDCLRDVFDLPHLEEILAKIQSGEIQVVPIETIAPSPVASGLLFNFISVYMYEWDAPKAERQMQSLAVSREMLDDVLGGAQLRDLLKPEAMAEVEHRAQHDAPGFQARSAEELALILDELGDLTTDEIIARCTGDARAWLEQLVAQNRVAEIAIPMRHGADTRWVPAERASEYQPLARSETILRRLLAHSGILTRDDILNRYAFDETWLDETLARLTASREIVSMPNPESRIPEFVSHSNLDQIHRRTLSLLRKEIQPVSVFQYADFLARWQYLAPRLTGADALPRALEQLRGVALPLAVWERDVLPARVADFDASDLDALCQRGEIIWAADKTRLRFFARGEGALFLASPDESALSDDAQKILTFLKAEGASFAADIAGAFHGERAFNQTPLRALAELVAAGLVTNDALDAVRRVGAFHETSLQKSELETELAARLTNVPRALSHTRYRDAKRRVAKRLRQSEGAIHESSQQMQGRWSLVQRAAVLEQMSDEERAEKLARVYLARYGIVTRECLEREDCVGDWALLYLVFNRWEMRGGIRRGYFVDGLSGVQFAHKDAVEMLRAADVGGETLPLREFVVLNATDPANIANVARIASTHIVLSRGQPIVIAENSGECIVAHGKVDAITRALRTYLERAPRRVVVKQWNGTDVRGSEGEAILQSLGFYRTPTGMER